MFKIAKANYAAPLAPTIPDNAGSSELLAQFSVSEGWTSDLSTGIIRLGEWSALVHGVSEQECGLLGLLRSYDPADRSRIIELFEQAATNSSSFCFSTTIIMAGGIRQPVFCLGESMGLEEKYSGTMVGVFIFPRFKLKHGALSPSVQ